MHSNSGESPLGSAFSRVQLDRRTLLRAGAAGLGAATTASLLAACSGGSSSASGGKATVRVWSWYTDSKDVLPQVVKDFEDKHPNISVQLRTFGTPDQYLPALTAAVSGGDVPEIFAPHVRALTYGEQGISADLKKDLGSDFLTDFFDAENQEYSTGGKQYAVGWEAQTFGIFYNPDIFSQAGVDGEPETWDDLIAAAAKINALGKSSVAFSANPGTSALDFFLPLITQVTDDPTWFLKLDNLEKGYTWTSDPVVQALELNDKIVKAKVFQPGTTGTSGDQATQAFYTGSAAMLFAGSWIPQGLIQNATPDFVKKYKIMKTPAIRSGARHWTADQAGAGFAVSETSKNKEAALELLKYLYSPDVYSKLMNDSNAMPATQSAVDRIANPQVKLMASWLPDGCPHIPFGPGSSAAGDPLTKIFDQKAGPSEVAKEMQQAVLNAKGGTQ
ncbi:MAG: extracellular solute-binding protein [Microbacteriaceae bacterium]|nr:extracellular solute-binding protein [Microbacteriaceae bacterium]MCL2793800.1 extracellular solute-binding protein [Microbacteriaceae bacterium]